MLLAIDAGGSSTRALLIHGDGRAAGRGLGGPGNHILSGWELAQRSIRDAVADACRDARIEPGGIRCAVAGSAGVGANGEGREAVEGLLAELAPSAQVSAIGDMVAAYWGALSSDHGVVVAAGTGSVCYGRTAAGRGRQVGGWGHIMGDEGSAYDIAVRALRATARAVDGRGPETALGTRIAAAVGAPDFMGVALRVYGEPMTRDAIARLASSVADAAARGDTVAADLLRDAGRELGLAAVTALRALALTEIATPVAYTGAVFDAGAPVIEAFRQTVTAAMPRADVVAAEFPPVVGAFKLALRTSGLPFTADVAAALRASLGREQR